MADLPTRQDLFRIGADHVLQRATKIDPGQVYVQGSDVNIFCGAASTLAYQLVLQLAHRTNTLLLDGAEDEDLYRYAWDRYSLPRKGAASAVGQVLLFRDLAGLAGSVGIGEKLLTLGGVEYITTGTASFASSTLSVLVNVRAVQAGKASQVGRNSIRKFATPGGLFDTKLQVTNDLPTAHGEDAEDDQDFRNRIRDFWKTVRRGVVGAIEYGARSVAGVVSARAEEVTSNGDAARIVMLYIADSSGVASLAKATEVRDALVEFRSAGIKVVVVTSMPQIASVALALQFQNGVDSDGLTEIIRAAVVEFINTLPVSGPLYRAALHSVLQRYVSSGLIVSNSTVASPSGDLIPEPGKTIRTTITNVVAL